MNNCIITGHLSGLDHLNQYNIEDLVGETLYVNEEYIIGKILSVDSEKGTYTAEVYLELYNEGGM